MDERAVRMENDQVEQQRVQQYELAVQHVRHIVCPLHCPTLLPVAGLDWSCLTIAFALIAHSSTLAAMSRAVTAMSAGSCCEREDWV